MNPQRESAPRVVVCGVLRRGGRFLVARRAEGVHQGGKWEFPGGKVRPGETLPEALRREVAEETGCSFRDAVLFHVEEHAYPERVVRLHFFLCLEPEEGASTPEEGPELRWVDLEELPRLEMPPANRNALGLLAEQFAGDSSS